MEYILSHNQQQVVDHRDGPALVLAGPGSGKTLVITRRLCNLHQDCPQEKIVCLTFSRAAAKEMQSRYHATIDTSIKSGEQDNILFATVHSLAYSILQKSWPYGKKPTLLESTSCTQSKKKILQDLYFGVNNTKLTDSDTEKLANWISRAQTLPEESKERTNEIQIKNFNQIYKNYICYKESHNLIDFDDMILYASNILQQDKFQRDYWGGMFHYVQVDEAQDLTLSQFEIVKALAPHGNILIVADDDQSIYGFRGANPQNLMAFQEEMRNCRKYILNDNFRSAPQIVEFATKIIATNTVRFAKKFNPQSQFVGKIHLLHMQNSLAQAKYILSSITSSKCHSYGILYRNNSSALTLTALLLLQGYAFHVSGGNLQPYMEYINLFFMACIRQGQSLQGTSYKPDTLFRLVMKNNFTDLCKKKYSLYEQSEEVIEITIDFLYSVCHLCKSLNEVRRLLQKMEGVYLTGENAGWEENPLGEKEIYLSTIHSAKGLEYDSVFLIDLNKNEFPGKSATSGFLLEEERRLFYVGITRARQSLHLSFIEKHGLSSVQESIFFKEATQARR